MSFRRLTLIDDINLLESGQPDIENGLWPINERMTPKPYIFYLGQRHIATIGQEPGKLATVERLLPHHFHWGRYVPMETKSDVCKLRAQIVQFLLKPSPDLVDAALAVDPKNICTWSLYVGDLDASEPPLKLREAAEMLGLEIDQTRERLREARGLLGDFFGRLLALP